MHIFLQACITMLLSNISTIEQDFLDIQYGCLQDGKWGHVEADGKWSGMMSKETSSHSSLTFWLICVTPVQN